MVRYPQVGPGRAPVKVMQDAEETIVKIVETYYTPIYILTAVFGAIFILGPFFVKKGNNAGIIRVNLMLTAFSMWIFWVTVYISQMNPLMGPRLHNTSLAWLAYTWGNPAEVGDKKNM